MLDSNKILIELGSVKIDLSFEPGSATTKLEEPGGEAKQLEVRSSFVLGVVGYSRADLEKYKSKNERVKVTAVGMVWLADDISPALALQAVDSIKVYGAFKAQGDVKEALLQAGRLS